MAKNTQTTGSNTDQSALTKFISCGQSEIDHKGKGEVKSSLALAYALLAADDADTLSTWREKLSDLHNGDEKLRDAARFAFADYVGANTFLDTSGDKERKTQDYRNLMMRQEKRMQFAIDVNELKHRDAIIIHEGAKNVTASIKGSSDLSRRVWSERGWQDKKAIADKRNPMMDIIIAQRASLTMAGEVSWNQLAEMIAKWAGRKQNNARTVQTISAKQPFAALKAIKSIVSADPAAAAVHFSAVESKMLALETAEDIAAFATEGDDPEIKAARAMLDGAFEHLRTVLQAKINSKAKLLTMKEAA